MLQFSDIIDAQRRISQGIEETPCLYSHTLSTITGANVHIKFENMQFTASFKERGALNKLLQLTESQKQSGVIAASAGNHAKALAYHAQRLNIPAVIVMPKTTPNIKVVDTEKFGATVLLHGDNYDEAQAYANQHASKHSLCFVHAFDDPQIIAGQGTLALELLSQCSDMDALVVQIGGGGMLAGMMLAIKKLQPTLPVYGVRCDAYPWHDAGDSPTTLSTIAEGIAVKEPAHSTRSLFEDQLQDILVVSEKYIERAVALYVNIEKTVAEGAGAAGLAALLQYPEVFSAKKVGVILSGGNIDPKTLAYILLRDLAQSGLIVRLQIQTIDAAGTLSKLAAIIGDQGGNIINVEHDRIFSKLRVKDAKITMTVEVKDQQHGDQICAELRGQGYRVDFQ